MPERAGLPRRPPRGGESSARDPSRWAHDDPAPERRPSASDYGLPETVTCPFCDCDDTELHSPFGPQLSVASYWCRRCHTAFDWVKR